MVDYETRQTVTLGELLPLWWGEERAQQFEENQTKQVGRIGNDPTTCCWKGVVKDSPENNSCSKPFAEPFTKRYK